MGDLTYARAAGDQAAIISARSGWRQKCKAFLASGRQEDMEEAQDSKAKAAGKPRREKAYQWCFKLDNALRCVSGSGLAYFRIPARRA